jgi:hypothetical protein
VTAARSEAAVNLVVDGGFEDHGFGIGQPASRPYDHGMDPSMIAGRCRPPMERITR